MTDLTSGAIATLRHRALATLAEVTESAALEAWRVQYLGRKGEVPQLLRNVKELSSEERRIIGEQGNQLRRELENVFKERLDQLTFPDTASADPRQREAQTVSPGYLHPLTLTIRRIEAIFTQLGFTM